MKVFPLKLGLHLEPFDHHRGKLPLLRPTSPRRTGIFLAVNFVGFIVVNCFWLFLSTGEWVDLHPSSYWHSLLTPLGMSFLHPLSVLEHHWMVFVFGLLLAVIIFMPIVVAVMYRLVYAIALTSIVVVLGHSPTLALTLALGCFLAARTPLRSDMPFLAVMLGLLPAGLYLALLTFVGMEPAALPFERLLVKAPLLLAMVLAVAASGLVLAVARLIGYRPGGIWPIVAVLLAVPVTLFYANEGPAALRFNLLMQSPALRTVTDGRMTLQQWCDLHQCPLPQENPHTAVWQQFSDGERRLLLRQCKRFLRRYEKSDASPSVLYLWAEVASLRPERDAVESSVVRFSSQHVNVAAKPLWERLVQDYGHAPQAALARWRLGELYIREGNPQEGLRHLVEARRKLRLMLEGRQDHRDPSGVGTLSWPRPEAYEQALDQVEQLLWLLQQTHTASGTPSSTADVLKEWLSLDAVSLGATAYGEQLDELTKWRQCGALADNMMVARALVVRDPGERARRLLELSQQRDSDAWVQATLELGLLALQSKRDQPATAATATTSAPQMPRLGDPADYFRAVSQAGQTPWKRAADFWLLQAPGEGGR